MQEKAWHELKPRASDGFSFRVAADFVRKNYMLDLGRAPFPIADATLVAKAGACGTARSAPARSPISFPTSRSGNVCTDPGCFAAKRAAQQARTVEKLEAKGVVVITGDKAKAALPHDWSDLRRRTPASIDPKAANAVMTTARAAPMARSPSSPASISRSSRIRATAFRPVVQLPALRKALARKGVKIERRSALDR
jgi:hypothetical protein